MKNYLLLILIFTTLFSCNQREKNKTLGAPLSSIKNNSVNIPAKTINDSIKKSLSPGEDTLIFNLKMDSANQHVSVPISISGGDTLLASLSSDDQKANIRISQVQFPDSTFDGPFGRNLNYKIQAAGNYKIIIGEDMMAGSRWKGGFIVKVWVK